MSPALADSRAAPSGERLAEVLNREADSLPLDPTLGQLEIASTQITHIQALAGGYQFAESSQAAYGLARKVFQSAEEHFNRGSEQDRAQALDIIVQAAAHMRNSARQIFYAQPTQGESARKNHLDAISEVGDRLAGLNVKGAEAARVTEALDIVSSEIDIIIARGGGIRINNENISARINLGEYSAQERVKEGLTCANRALGWGQTEAAAKILIDTAMNLVVRIPDEYSSGMDLGSKKNKGLTPYSHLSSVLEAFEKNGFKAEALAVTQQAAIALFSSELHKNGGLVTKLAEKLINLGDTEYGPKLLGYGISRLVDSEESTRDFTLSASQGLKLAHKNQLGEQVEHILDTVSNRLKTELDRSDDQKGLFGRIANAGLLLGAAKELGLEDKPQIKQLKLAYDEAIRRDVDAHGIRL